MQPQPIFQTAPFTINHLLTPTGVTPANQLPLYDFSGLGKLAKNPAFVREMQQLFIEQVPVQIAQLWGTIEQEDWFTIAHQAHSLKATFGNLRIEPSTGLLKEMEIIAFQHRDKQELTAILRVVASAAEVVVRVFKQELNLTASPA